MLVLIDIFLHPITISVALKPLNRCTIFGHCFFDFQTPTNLISQPAPYLPHRNPSSVPSLRAANEAAAKSSAARSAGSQQAISTSVPDPVRLVPSVTARTEPQWCCDKCQHINTGNKEACVRCRCANPGYSRAQITAVDALTCDRDGMVTLMTEKGHASLKRALADAGTPLLQTGIGGTVASIRDALQRRGHERLMRIVYLLIAAPGARLPPATNSVLGDFGMQRLMEAAAKLRGQAYLMAREGVRLAEDFSSFPSSANITASTAYPKLIAAIAAQSMDLIKDPHGLHVIVKAVNLSPPTEVLSLAQHMIQDFPNYSPAGQVSKEASIYMCNMISRLCNLCYEATPAAPAAAEILNRLMAEYRHNFRVFNAHARHPFLGLAITEAVQGALPRADTFRACHMLACNAPWIANTKGGVQTLSQTLSLLSDDPLARKMVRDIACTVALALRPNLADVACSTTTEGATLVQQLLEVLSREREDDWVKILVQELVKDGVRLQGACSASFDVLCAALALGQIDPALSMEHLATLGKAGADISVIRKKVDTLRAAAEPLPAPFFDTRSEVQPEISLEFARKRLPMYIWDLVQQQKGGTTTTAAVAKGHIAASFQAAPPPAALPDAINGSAAAYFEQPRSTAYSTAGTAAADESGWGPSVPSPDMGWGNGEEYSVAATPAASTSPAPPLPSFMSLYDHQSLFPQAGSVPAAAVQPSQSAVPSEYHYYDQQQQQQSAAANSQPDPCAFFPQFTISSASPSTNYTPQSVAAPPLYDYFHMPDQQQQQQPQQYMQQQYGGGVTRSAFEDASNAEEFDNLESMLQRLSAQDTSGTAAAMAHPYRPQGAAGASHHPFTRPENQPGAQTSVRPPVIMRFDSDTLVGSAVQPSALWAAPPSSHSGHGRRPPQQAVQYNANHSSTLPAVNSSSAPTESAQTIMPQVARHVGGDANAVPSVPVGHWTCGVCTYLHMGKEAEFLVCAVCESQRPG